MFIIFLGLVCDFVLDGLKVMVRWFLNMNILVGIGVFVVFVISFIFFVNLSFNWDVFFFDELVMLFVFVFLGRFLEVRVCVKVLSDM